MASLPLLDARVRRRGDVPPHAPRPPARRSRARWPPIREAPGLLAHADAQARRRRAVPLPLRHEPVHRLQVLRGGLQRAERQPGQRSTGAASAKSRAASFPTPSAPTSRWAAITALDPTCLTGLPGRRLHQGRRHGHRAPQRRHLHRLPVLHVELLLRRAAVQPGARRRRQVRHVPRPARARPGAGLRGRLPRGRDSHRDRQHRRVASRGDAVATSAIAAPGMPTADASLSTTRVTLPEVAAAQRAPARSHRTCDPAEPHWPLVVMTVLTQLRSARSPRSGCCNWSARVDRLGLAAHRVARRRRPRALGARRCTWAGPIHAYRALKMWRRSWLSREVLLFSRLLRRGRRLRRRAVVRLAGSAALGAADGDPRRGRRRPPARYIYRVPSRPAWNSPLTLLQFGATAGVLGPLFAARHRRRRRVAARARRCALRARAGARAGRRLPAAHRGRHACELRGTARLLRDVARAARPGRRA